MTDQVDAQRRATLNRDRVLRAALTLADEGGIDSLSMRKLAQALGVVPMALYKHFAGKDELLAGMVDAVVAEIDPPDPGAGWKSGVRQRILSARQALLRHRWAARVIESRAEPTPAVLEYLDSMIRMFREGGLSVDLTHHVMHAMGSRILGFSQELFEVPDSQAAQGVDRQAQATQMLAMAEQYPYVTEMAMAAAHVDESVVGSGCDDQFEFEFALDLLLDGIEKLERQGWTSAVKIDGAA